MAKFLLEHSNINVNLPDNEGRSPLHVAAWQGHLEMVELLVAQGMNNIFDKLPTLTRKVNFILIS